jgi:hypothetical protein
MKILRIFALGLAAALLAILGFYAYLGGFKPIDVRHTTFGPLEIIYTLHKGSYKTLKTAWDTFESRFRAAGLEECDSLALYPDPPGTPEEDLRSVLACRLDSLPQSVKMQLKAKFPSFIIPKDEAITAEFPFKNQFSYFMGPTKVYPKFHETMRAEHFTAPLAIEVYGLEKARSQIQFFIPVKMKRAVFESLFKQP